MVDARGRLAASSAAAALAEVITLPIDVTKTRLQTQSQNGTNYEGMVDCILTTIEQEGVLALWRGLLPALIRQVSYSSLSLMLFEPILALMHSDSDGDGPSYMDRLLAGGTAGGIAIAVFTPTEVLKTQMQNAERDIGMNAVCFRVLRRDGIFGLWAGVVPNVARTFLVNAAELGTYSHAKGILSPLVGAGLLAYVGASAIAGLTSACVSTPADVIKTRLMQQAGGGARAYSGIFDAARQIVALEGFGALYSGMTPILWRKVLWCTAFFVLYESLLAAL